MHTTSDNEFTDSTLDFTDLTLNEKVKINELNNNLIVIDYKPVRRKDCVKLSKLINAKKYLQCSCYDIKSVQAVMNCAIKYAYNYKKDRNFNYIMPRISYLPSSKEIKQSESTYTNFINNRSNNNLVSDVDRNTNVSNNNNKKNTLCCFCCTNRNDSCDSFSESKL